MPFPAFGRNWGGGRRARRPDAGDEHAAKFVSLGRSFVPLRGFHFQRRRQAFYPQVITSRDPVNVARRVREDRRLVTRNGEAIYLDARAGIVTHLYPEVPYHMLVSSFAVDARNI